MADPFKQAKFFKRSDVAGVKGNRYIELESDPDIPEHAVAYRHADDLAKAIGSVRGRFRCILGGRFIFGDLIEALIVNNNWLVRELWINTLSLSNENIDSLQNLINPEADYVRKLNLIVSDHFYQNYRSTFVRYAYDELDVDNRFQLAACRTHMKTTLIWVDDGTPEGRKIVIEGSANLRSSGNIESILVEECPEWFDINREILDGIVCRYKTIKKPLGERDTWLITDQTVKTRSGDWANTMPQNEQTPQRKNEPRNAKPE